jgi:hypothetical protein
MKSCIEGHNNIILIIVNYICLFITLLLYFVFNPISADGKKNILSLIFHIMYIVFFLLGSIQLVYINYGRANYMDISLFVLTTICIIGSFYLSLSPNVMENKLSNKNEKKIKLTGTSNIILYCLFGINLILTMVYHKLTC